jgi:hypothetical protein
LSLLPFFHALARFRSWRNLVGERWSVLRWSRPPVDLIKLLDHLNVDEGTGTVPEFDAVVNTETGRKRRCEEESTIW